LWSGFGRIDCPFTVRSFLVAELTLPSVCPTIAIAADLPLPDIHRLTARLIAPSLLEQMF
jgi:hypothetical protein